MTNTTSDLTRGGEVMGSTTRWMAARMRPRRSAGHVFGVVLGATMVLGACSGHHSNTASATSRSASGSAGTSAAGSSAAAGGSTAAGGAAATTGAKPTSGSGGSAASAAAPTTPAVGGAEGVTAGAVQTCSIASAAAAATAFHGRIGSTSVKTSAIGNPLCTFGLMNSNIGAAATSSGTLTLTLNPSTTAAQFASVRASATAPVSVSGVGDQAYYVANSSTLLLLRGTKSVSIQAQMNTPAGTQYVKAIQADLVALGKVAAAQL